jgi:hypothetical protein
MKAKQITYVSILLILGFALGVGFAQDLTDDFNRATLGSSWSTTPDYGIDDGALSNNTTTSGWDYLATYTAAANPLSVSIMWDPDSTDTAGCQAGGIAMYLDSPSSTANGYVIYRRYATIYLYEVVNGTLGDQINSTSASLSVAEPGDVIKIVPRPEVDGNYFDFYINDQLDGTVVDVGKRQGAGGVLYSGVMLYGTLNNDVDRFTVRAPYVQVTFPNGGETLLGGTDQTVTWNSVDYSGNVDIFVSYDSGNSWSALVQNISNTGSYTWTVPDQEETAVQIKVQASGADLPFDTSDADFTIEQNDPTITVLSPNGGENWIIGTEQTITWVTTGDINSVNIWYTPDNGITKNLVASNVPADQGYYNWTVPQTLFSDEMKILVERTVLDQTYSDESDAVFSVSSLVHLRVQDASGEPGTDDNIVRLHMDNKVNVWALQLTITDDRSVLDVPVIDPLADPPEIKVKPVGRASTLTLRARKTGNSVTLAIVNLTGVIPVGEGPVAEIYYSIADDPTLINSSSELIINDVAVFDVEGNLQTPRLSSGRFYYVNAGDLVSPFSSVTWADVEQMIDITLGLTPPDDYMLSGDMNNDGVINLFDVLQVYDLAKAEGF